MRGPPGGARTWLLWAAALAAAAIALVVAVNALVISCPGLAVAHRQTMCMSNLVDLADRYTRTVNAKRFDPSLHGSAQVLSWFGPNELRLLDERMLICPADEAVVVPEDDAARRAYHPADASALRAARGLGSYAVRDFERFPVDPSKAGEAPILCDRQGDDGRTPHHGYAIMVLFADGSCRKMTYEEVGYGRDEPVVVGPDSKIPLLRVFERP